MSMVDLPTPGSPPTRTRLPGTMPPPSTRLSSAQASGVRAASSVGISLSRTTRAASRGLDFDSLVAFRTWNSCSVFQARQCGHWPAQRRLSPPHSVHTKVMVDLRIGRLCTHDRVFTRSAVPFYCWASFYLLSVKAPPSLPPRRRPYLIQAGALFSGRGRFDLHRSHPR